MFAFPSCMKKKKKKTSPSTLLSDAECALQKISIAETGPEPAASIGDSSACEVKGGAAAAVISSVHRLLFKKFSEMCVCVCVCVFFLQAYFSPKLRREAALRLSRVCSLSTRSLRGLFENETSSRAAERPCHHFLQCELI